MKTNIEKTIELEKGKFYIFKVKNITMNMMKELKDKLTKEGIRGIIYDGEIEVVIPKNEESQNEN